MTTLNGSAEDDRALDALIVLAFLEAPMRELPVVSGPEPDLDPVDLLALDALGVDLVRKLLNEESEPWDNGDGPRPP